METTNDTMITVETKVHVSLPQVWNYWIAPQHITQWCQASEDWHAPYADNDVRVGGKFKTTMAAKDGSMSFDFEGEYIHVKTHENMQYLIADGRKVEVIFQAEGNEIRIIEHFEPETENPLELQRAGWQSILDSFKAYAERLK